MLASDVFRVGMIVNVFWVLVALFLNRRWYKYSLKLNDEWAEFYEDLYETMKEYYTKGEGNSISMNGKYEWCSDCKEYDSEHHCCPRWNSVIRSTVEDLYNLKGDENNEQSS